MPRLRRFPEDASFFREYKRNCPDLSLRIMRDIDAGTKRRVAQNNLASKSSVIPAIEMLFLSEALQDVDIFHNESACAKAPARQPSPWSIYIAIRSELACWHAEP